MNPIIIYCKKMQNTVVGQFPHGHLIAVGALTLSLAVILALTPDSKITPVVDAVPVETVSTPDQNITSTEIELPNIDFMFAVADGNEKQIAKEPAQPTWQELTIKSGDNLSTVFARAGLNDRDLYDLVDDNKDAKDLRSIIPGQKVAFLIDNQGKLQELKYVKNNLESLRFTRNSVGFTSQQISLKPEVRRTYRQGVINSSLFVAAKQAGLPNNLTMELANIFGWDVDFALDIQKGDQFKVMYEEHYVEGRKIGTGAILSAEFTNAGKTYKAVRYTNKDGSTRYYAPDGKGMNKAFLRTPVDFARISSSFSLGRLHPVLNTIRAHKGTDYAAATGTPIRSTGDGKVIFAGRQGGYGNCIMIQHGQGYETVYGHMNNFAKGITTGSRVSQGQVIGYVGMTGLATGPHLHYEFHVNGQVRDPVTVPLPQSMGIASNEKDRFSSATQTLVAQLDDFDRSSHLAMTEGQTKSN